MRGCPGERRTGADLLAGRTHDQRGCQHCACEGLGGRFEVHARSVLSTVSYNPDFVPSSPLPSLQSSRGRAD